MNLNEFKKHVDILDPSLSCRLRKKYIKIFIDYKCEFYIQKIKNLHKFSDGLCYTGYLWDCMKSPNRITWEQIILLQSYIDYVFVFWDIHSCDRIFIPNYWKFPKESCLKMKYSDLCRNKIYLPEDIYIFDDTFQWTIVFTHETDLNNNDIFLECGVRGI